MKRRLDRSVIMAVAVATLLVAAALYFFFDPSGSALFPKCPFLQLTGYQCPGCGSQRAVHALLHGDIAAAWRFNAAMVAFVPVIAVMLFAEFTAARYPRFHRAVNSLPVITGAFVTLVLWWILRNI